jgi:hypothetical protein
MAELESAQSVFINYRREDSRVYADMLYTWLSDRYGDERVFKDVDTIELGLDFGEAIERVVAASDVMLVVIGGHWVTDQSGRRRLDEPDDYVRMEIQAGLARNMRVIPILVGNATMPLGADLPESLAGLTRRQAFELNDARLRADRDELLWRLDRVMAKGANGAAEPERTAPEPSAPPPPPPPSQPPAQPPPVQRAPIDAQPQIEPNLAEPQPDEARRLRRWGWALALGSLLIPFLAIGAVILGRRVIALDQGRSKRAGISIIAVAVILGLLSLLIWADSV